MRFGTLAVCALVLLAGCAGTTGTDATTTESTDTPTSTPTPTPTPTPTATPTPTPTPTPDPLQNLNQSGFEDEYVTQLEVNGYDVGNTYYESGTLVIKYRSDADNRTQLSQEFFDAAMWYPYILGYTDGYAPPRVRLWIQSADGDKIAHYDAKREWAQDVNEGEMTPEEYYDEVARTQTV